MVQRRDSVSFLLESRCMLALQLFDRDDAVKTRVTCLVYLSHAARTDGSENLIGSQTSAGSHETYGV